MTIKNQKHVPPPIPVPYRSRRSKIFRPINSVTRAVVWAINQLRNEMAHNLDSKTIDEKMKSLRKTYIDALEPKPAAHAKTQSDKEIVEWACGVCAGFLGHLISEAKTRRGIIDQHWQGP